MNKKMLALGDSYTIGTGVSPRERWPVQLCSRVSVLHGVQPTIVAQNGWTTTDLLRALAEAGLAPGYDLVSLLIGVNDQYDGLGEEKFLAGFERLLLDSIRLANGHASHVIVLSIPDYSVTPFVEGMDRRRIRAELEGFNRHKEKMTSDAGAHFVDIVDLSRRAQADRTLLAEDGLHPSGKMYALWVERLAPLVEDLLRITS